MSGGVRVVGWCLVGGAVAAGTVQLVNSRSAFHRSVVVPLLQWLPPETAHNTALTALSFGLGPKDTSVHQPCLQVRVWGKEFANPIGLAAGFDKDARAVDGLARCGFGFVEVGSVTPRAQRGNDKPRIFRLDQDQAVINRCGFNNDGVPAMAARLSALALARAHRQEQRAHFPRSLFPCDRPEVLVGVNLGKNKDQPKAEADYELGVLALGPYADYLVVNVSSPNTPNLRLLQGREELTRVVSAVLVARDWVAHKHNKSIPVLVKIAPDLSHADLADIAAVVQERGVDGVIVSNTTISRPQSLKSAAAVAQERGGLSGAPLRPLATQTLATMYRLTGGKVPLVGVGGVGSGADAYEKIRNGATLVQVYSALAFKGVGLVPDIKDELAELLRRDGFKSVHEAVGVDVDLSDRSP